MRWRVQGVDAIGFEILEKREMLRFADGTAGTMNSHVHIG